MEARCQHGVYPLQCSKCQGPDSTENKHVGRVWIKPEYLPEILGFPGGIILQHIPINFEREMIGFVIQHPDMPDVSSGKMFQDIPIDYQVTSIKQKDNEVTIIAVRKDFR